MKKYSSITKVNYHHTSHKKRRLWLAIIATLLVVGFLFPLFITQVSALVLYPFHAATVWVKNSDGLLPTYLRSRDGLVSELEAMRAQMSTETGTQLSIKRLLEENMQLRAMTKVSTSTERLVARVVARPNSLAYDLLQIDQGSDQGLVVGAPVYSGLDTVIGVLAQVAPNYSFVELFTAPSFESTAFIVGPNVFSVLEGMGGGVARLRLPQGISIAKGQLVLLPGIASGVYGEIAWVENHPTQPEQYGYVVPPLAMNGIFYVSVDTQAVQSKSEVEIEENVKNAIREKTVLSGDTIKSINFKLEANDINTTSATSSATSTLPL